MCPGGKSVTDRPTVVCKHCQVSEDSSPGGVHERATKLISQLSPLTPFKLPFRRWRLRYLGRGGQREMEGPASSVVGRRPDTATVQFDDRPADRQADAATLWLCGIEGIEDPIRLLGWQTDCGMALPPPRYRLSSALQSDSSKSSSKKPAGSRARQVRFTGHGANQDFV